MNIFNEIYQILFLSSIIFIAYFFIDLGMKMIGRFVRKNEEIKYNSTTTQKILFWISLTIFLSYLI